VMSNFISFTTYVWTFMHLLITTWSLLGPGMEVGLTFNCMKGIHIFSPFNCWVIFFFFYQVNWMCNAWSCFKALLNWCSINIINNAKWVMGISIHIFTKNQNSIRCVMILKVMCVLILWLVLEIETQKSN
jgi:hypothetical protein